MLWNVHVQVSFIIKYSKIKCLLNICFSSLMANINSGTICECANIAYCTSVEQFSLFPFPLHQTRFPFYPVGSSPSHKYINKHRHVPISRTVTNKSNGYKISVIIFNFNALDLLRVPHKCFILYFVHLCNNLNFYKWFKRYVHEMII